MTNPVLTDDLIAGLEAAADTSIEGCSVWYEEDGFLITLADTCDQSFMAKASPATVKALLAHIAELKQQLAAASVDAERYRWLREACDNDPGNLGIEYACKPGVDVAIDAARNPSAD